MNDGSIPIEQMFRKGVVKGMLYKHDIISLLNEAGIKYELFEHPAVFNMAEDAKLNIPHLDRTAKNIFVCDDKKPSYILISVMGAARVDLKSFARTFGYRPLHLASENSMFEKLGLTPGSVSPFGLLNSTACDISFYIDQRFKDAHIFVHPNDNTASVFLKTSDLVELIKDHSKATVWFDPLHETHK